MNLTSSSRRDTGWLLRLEQTASDVWEWQAVRPVTIWPEKGKGKSYFSAVGFGAESWIFRLRPGLLRRDYALLYDGCHHLLTAVSRPSPGVEQWEAARIAPVSATRARYFASADSSKIRRRALDASAALTFPVCLTERYLRSESGEIHASANQTMVAVVPKVITCELQDVLTIHGRQYVVRAVHDEDPWKNEYELVYEGDV